jgi:cell wall-associated NlpC family hydrolase
MALKIDHLEGLEFNIETRNCYHLVRDVYRDNFGIELPDFPCPTDWYEKGLDLYARLAPDVGFDIIHDHPRDWRAGDIILMAIGTSTGSHVALVLDNGNIFHHLVGQRSRVTSYGGLFRNTTVGVYRHRDVAKMKPAEHLVDIREFLPPHVLRRLEKLEEARQQTAEDADVEGA